MKEKFDFLEIGRLAVPGDNVAIATCRLEAGSVVVYDGKEYTLDYTVLEGHRFTVRAVKSGEALLSWGLPFGRVLRDIAPFGYVCNEGILQALRGRAIDMELPFSANFVNRLEPYRMEEAKFRPAAQAPRYEHEVTFRGYRRAAGRGVGTRNYIILLGTTSHTAGYVRQLERRLSDVARQYPNIDGIVAIAHTEGGNEKPNNLPLLLRSLAGYMVHPNVGAVLAVDYGDESLSNTLLRQYLLKNNEPLADMPHQFLSLDDGFQKNLDRGEEIVKEWFDTVNKARRTSESLSRLKIALQCGGSDAFSGVSGNPLASWVAKEIIRYGGAVNLAETDELVGAESYILRKVKDLPTARKFLSFIERYKEWAGWHGVTLEGNPSGGNLFRGLYNITLKSIGAAMKRHPDVRLDHVIDYGERMILPGFYFMDSPGNDLESVAGQVAAGCNMIFFITGNGSITNFPFVPTLKVITTTRRFELLKAEMDVNAGAYLDGKPMDELGRQMLDLTLEVASGKRSAGEKAGHSQVQIWRDWRLTKAGDLETVRHRATPTGNSLPIKRTTSLFSRQFSAFPTTNGYASERTGLILPTSLCSGQIARMAAVRLNEKRLGREKGLTRFVALAHTEGCGTSDNFNEIYVRTLLGYLMHPLVQHGLLLEHGCEKTHNDYMRLQVERAGLDPLRLGWASVQLDGGIQKVMQKIERWFTGQIKNAPLSGKETVGLEALRVALLSRGKISPPAGLCLAEVAQIIVAGGGTVILPGDEELFSEPGFLKRTLANLPPEPSLAFAERPKPGAAGFHIMETFSSHWSETITGLGATGAGLILAYIGSHTMQSHPLIPVLQVTAESLTAAKYGNDMDLLLQQEPAHWPFQLLNLIMDTLSGNYTPKLNRQGNIDFQITRGLLGISL